MPSKMRKDIYILVKDRTFIRSASFPRVMTHFYFSLGKQKFLHGHAEKNSWADSKKQISYKTTFKQRQKIILQGKKLPSHSKIVHTNRTLKDSIKKEQIFHYLYGFI